MKPMQEHRLSQLEKNARLKPLGKADAKLLQEHIAILLRQIKDEKASGKYTAPVIACEDLMPSDPTALVEVTYERVKALYEKSQSEY